MLSDLLTSLQEVPSPFGSEPAEQVPEEEPALPKTNKQSFQMQECPCVKTVNASTFETDGINFTSTTCGFDAYRRGKGTTPKWFSKFHFLIWM